MDINALLEALKVDLGIKTKAYDERLAQYLQSAIEAITIEGVTLDLNSLGDCNLVIHYAAWIWRKRDTGEGMPRSLRWMLNNRLFSEKV